MAYRFEDFVLDLARGTLLTTAGHEIPLRRKSFQLLRLLVENVGQLLDRDGIYRAIWTDLAVSDDSITQCIHEIRRALGDKAQRIVRTVPGRGYLMEVEVTTGDAVRVAPTVTAIASPAPGDLPVRRAFLWSCCHSTIWVALAIMSSMASLMT